MDIDEEKKEFTENDHATWCGLSSGFVTAARREGVLPMRFEPEMNVTVGDGNSSHMLKAWVSATQKEKSPSTFPKVILVELYDERDPSIIAKACAEYEWTHAEDGTSIPCVVETQYYPNELLGVNAFVFRRIINEMGARFEQPSEFE